MELLTNECEIPHTQYYIFFFNDTATTEIYPLSLHDALPISRGRRPAAPESRAYPSKRTAYGPKTFGDPSFSAYSIRHKDRKSTRLNSSHGYISYAVFCLKKKKILATLISILYYHHTYTHTLI